LSEAGRDLLGIRRIKTRLDLRVDGKEKKGKRKNNEGENGGNEEEYFFH